MSRNQFDPFARFYDDDYGSYTEDLLFYREMARLSKGPVLELMCGTGRVLLPLAEAGLKVVGVDASPLLLKRAEEKIQLGHLERKAKLVEQDVRSLHLNQQFPLICIAINSFLHLETVEDQLKTLQGCRDHLLPGGLLIIDLFNPIADELVDGDGTLVLAKTFTLSENGATVQKFVSRQIDLAEQTMEVTFNYDEIAEDGLLRRYPLTFILRWIYRYEIEHLVARVGLQLQEVYGSYELEPYESQSERMILFITRP